MNDRHKEMARLYVEDGLTYQQIADQYGISRQRVGQVLTPLNLNDGGQRRRMAHAAELRTAHARISAGKSTLAEEAERLGYKSADSLGGVLRKNGLRFQYRRKSRTARHGELLRYNRGCRCKRCAAAMRVYNRSLRNREGGR